MKLKNRDWYLLLALIGFWCSISGLMMIAQILAPQLERMLR